MAATDQKLFVFAYIDTEWLPCGQLTLSEDGAQLLASTFAYGLRYLLRPGAIEVDPVALSAASAGSVSERSSRSVLPGTIASR